MSVLREQRTLSGFGMSSNLHASSLAALLLLVIDYCHANSKQMLQHLKSNEHKQDPGLPCMTLKCTV